MSNDCRSFRKKLTLLKLFMTDFLMQEPLVFLLLFQRDEDKRKVYKSCQLFNIIYRIVYCVTKMCIFGFNFLEEDILFWIGKLLLTGFKLLKEYGLLERIVLTFFCWNYFFFSKKIHKCMKFLLCPDVKRNKNLK